jgi:hypothetical protein
MCGGLAVESDRAARAMSSEGSEFLLLGLTTMVAAAPAAEFADAQSVKGLER